MKQHASVQCMRRDPQIQGALTVMIVLRIMNERKGGSHDLRK